MRTDLKGRPGPHAGPPGASTVRTLPLHRQARAQARGTPKSVLAQETGLESALRVRVVMGGRGGGALGLSLHQGSESVTFCRDTSH